MSKRDKLIERIRSRPNDFTFDELSTLLGYFDYLPGKKTGGSRVVFTNGSGDYIRLHKPHPRNVLKQYQVDDIIAVLSERGFL